MNDSIKPKNDSGSDAPRFPKRWPTIGIVFLSILLPYFFAAFFIQPEDGVIPQSARIYIFIGEIFILLPSAYYVLRNNYNPRFLYRLRTVTWTVFLWAAIIGLSISVLGDEFDRVISMFIEPPAWLDESLMFFEINSFGEFLLIVGALVVITPIAEELLFRGFLQTTLEHRIRDVTKAILTTALAFALLHMNTWWILQLYVFGVVLSYLSWRSQSVLPGIAAHMSINGLSLLFSNLDPNGLGWYQMGNHVSPVWIGLAIAGTYYGFQRINREFPLEDRQSDTIFPKDNLAESDHPSLPPEN
ncbi:MAG: CPBP family intramembrane metalloprotease [Candidatus Marinimicrobia bacterium]|nr:CPBP family intramembrane metalloprotease [Candidatus Neomarinimicrobiota bacterium]MCF7829102.1 CPBP family intramembrane metalloprotease [Candidatus Neomarinimicrobiota bacterium]MCF7881499.1 CPBP family intramembrane metalloprotease [Candidatus Neomarinimicrobiota bacterium]